MDPSHLSKVTSDLEKTTLAVISQKTYISSLNKLGEHLTLRQMLMEPKKLLPVISSLTSNPATQGKHLTALKAVMKYSEFARGVAKTDKLPEAICKAFTESWATVEKRVETSKPTLQQSANLISLEEICKVRDTLPPHTPQKLVVALYTCIPPVRLDYGTCLLFKSIVTDAKLNELSEAGVESCITLTAPMTITILNHKTLKQYGRITTVLDPTDDDHCLLASEIMASYARNSATMNTQAVKVKMGGVPMFHGGKGEMYEILHSCFPGKSVTPVIFRHAYASNLANRIVTYGERKRIAQAMGHSVDQQLRYTYI